MPIQFPDFQRISFDEANPWLVGAERGQKFSQSAIQFPQDMRAKILANQIAAVNAKYAEPNAQAALTTAQQHNIFDPRIWNSEIGLRGAQAGLMGQQSKYYGQDIQSQIAARNAEANRTRFLTQNPQYISPEGMLISQAIGNQQNPQQQQMQSPQAGKQSNQGIQQTGGYNDASSHVGVQQSALNLPPMQPSSPQYSPMQYSQEALAFNPPQLPSPTGNPSLDNLYYKKFGMSPIAQTQLDLSKALSEKYQSQIIDRNKEFNTQAIVANQSTLDAHKFLDALERSVSLERGALGGAAPAISDAAQELDAYGNNMASSAARLFQGKNAIHSSDIALAQSAKANRKQNANVSFDLANGVIAKNDRLKEQQQFYAQGSQLGLKPEILDAMWSKYETERPYINPETKMPNDSYKGTWHDYLNPEAVNEFTHGKNFSFPNQKMLDQANWNKQDLTKIKSWAKENHLDPKDFDKKNLYLLAKKENISLSQLKLELAKMGAL